MSGLHRRERDPHGSGARGCQERRLQRARRLPRQLRPGNLRDAARQAFRRPGHVRRGGGGIRRRPDGRQRRRVLRHAQRELQPEAARREGVHSGVPGRHGGRVRGHDPRVHPDRAHDRRPQKPEDHQLRPAPAELPRLQRADQAALRPRRRDRGELRARPVRSVQQACKRPAHPEGRRRHGEGARPGQHEARDPAEARAV